MLVRSLTQASRRATISSRRPIAFFTPNTYKAAYNSSASNHEPSSSVSITSWSDRKRSQHEIQVKEEQTGEIVKPLQGDLQRTAKPLDGKVFERLTPTLTKFTLPGKVAVVTG